LTIARQAADSGSDAAVALITTVGTLVGVILGALITWTLEGQRQRRNERLLSKAALRLLRDDIATAVWRFQNMADQLRVVRDYVDATIPSWEDYREFFAGRWSMQDWTTFADAIQVARQTAVSLRAVLPADAPTGELNASLAQRASETAETLRSVNIKATTLMEDAPSRDSGLEG
jgi:hypothetical protein